MARFVELSWALRSGGLHHGEPRLGEGVEDWITEREIRRDKLIERREKESGRMKKGGPMGRTPDGLMILEDGSEIAVELELTPKRGASYRKIFSDYERQLGEGEIEGVRFYFASQKALKRASELARRHDLDGAAEFLHYNPVLEHRR